MPTFNDPAADAEEANAALRGLAHASQHIEDPEQMYVIMGDLIGGLRNLDQVLDQLAEAHERFADRAVTSFNDHAGGEAVSAETAAALRDAALQISDAEEALDKASGHARNLAWRRQAPSGPPEREEPAATGARQAEEAPSRWVSITFQDGDDADRALLILAELGHVDAIDYLAQWDYGDETTQDALANGYAYDEVPAFHHDQVLTSGDYAMVVNPGLRHVSLLRKFQPDPGDALDPEPAPEPGPVEKSGPELLVAYASPGAPKLRHPTSKPERDGSWFEHPGVAAVKQARGLGR